MAFLHWPVPGRGHKHSLLLVLHCLHVLTALVHQWPGTRLWLASLWKGAAQGNRDVVYYIIAFLSSTTIRYFVFIASYTTITTFSTLIVRVPNIVQH